MPSTLTGQPGQPDVMNDPTFQVNQDGQDVSAPDTCRICRGEGSDSEPLFHPCKCSGSIKFVHQDCLMAWLSHSNKKYCELCKASFRFTRLYKDDMPSSLPWRVFVPRVTIHAAKYLLFLLRSCLALSVWLVIVPYAIRYSWRSLFYAIDVEWIRQVSVVQQPPAVASPITNSTAHSVLDDRYFGPLAFRITRLALGSVTSFAWNLMGEDDIDTSVQLNHTHVRPRSSLLSGLETSPALPFSTALTHRILDILEGQIIVVVVIISWLVITLIRESILQQLNAIATAAELAEARNQNRAQTDAEAPHVPALPDQQANAQTAEAASTTDTTEAPWSASSSLADESPVPSEAEPVDDAPLAAEPFTSAPGPSICRPVMPSRDATPSAHDVHRSLEESRSAQEDQASSLHRVLGSASVGFDSQSALQPESSSHAQRPALSSSTSDDHATISSSFSEQDGLYDGLDGAIDQCDHVAHFLNQDRRRSGTVQLAPSAGIQEPGQSGTDPTPAIPSTDAPQVLTIDPPVVRADGESAAADAQASEDLPPVVDQAVDAQPGRGPLVWLYDFFWRDIELRNRDVPAPGPQVNAVPAPAGPAAEAAPEPTIIFDDVDPADDDGELNAQDIEDAEDAEDLQGAIQGILELLGINGPLVLLAQATAFSGAFVTVNLWGFVGVPYMAGKLALLYLAHPFFFGVLVPLQMVKTLVNVLSDAIACILDWSIIGVGALMSHAPDSVSSFSLVTLQAKAAQSSQWAFRDLETILPRLYSAFTSMHAASSTLYDSSFLLLSMTARQSLQEIKDDLAVISRFAATLITRLMTPAIYQGWSVGQLQQSAVATLAMIRVYLPKIIGQVSVHSQKIHDQVFSMDRNQTLSISLTTDPSLTHWSSIDRILTTALGYAFLGMLAAIYISFKPPVFSGEILRAIESAIERFLLNAGLIFKVVSIIGTELITFPIFRGVLLNIATLPIFGDATFASRLAYAQKSPYLATLFHWFLGMACTLNFGSFISMLRKKLRRGVLDFVKGPDDPDFHPVRVVLELSVPAQINSLFSASLFYTVLVLGGLGVPTWFIYWFGAGTLPIKWTYPEPSLEFPLGFVMYNLAIPWMLRYLKPMSYAPHVFDWWLRRAAQRLRLSHFLFGNRRKEEERVKRSWILRKLLPKADDDQVHFGGRYVHVPASDKARAPGERRVFRQTTESDVEASEALLAMDFSPPSKRPLWQAVYVPPAFKGRLVLFVLALWSLCFLVGFNATVTPLWIGRLICHLLASHGYRFGDTWAYTLGINLMLNVVCLAKFVVTARKDIKRTARISPTVKEAWATLRDCASRTFDMLWVYGGLAVLVPLLCAGVVELYLLVPWKTYLDNGASGSRTSTNSLWTGAIFANQSDANCVPASTVRMSAYAEWSIGHFLGSTLAKMAWRHNHRFLQAVVDQVVRDGYWRPNRALATRAVFAPLVLAMALIFGGPLLLARAIDALAPAQLDLLGMSWPQSVLLYRYSYPVCALLGLTVYLAHRAAKATSHWRNEVRDEVYLLGSKLHNWGETRPAAGSKALLMGAAEGAIAA